jgi:hypothetical protein
VFETVRGGQDNRKKEKGLRKTGTGINAEGAENEESAEEKWNGRGGSTRRSSDLIAGRGMLRFAAIYERYSSDAP